MPFIKKIYQGPSASFLDEVLTDVIAYVTDKSIHGDDTWQLIRSLSWPFGTVLKIPNHQDGEYGYMGLMTDKIRVGSSYANWFKQDDILRKEFALNKNGLGISDQTDFSILNGKVTTKVRIPHDVVIRTTYGPDGKPIREYSTNYTFNEADSFVFQPTPDIFASDANVLFFSMFKQYQADFDWSELMGNERNKIKAKPLKYYNTKEMRSPFLFDPPNYPGVGCPAIGYSPTCFDMVKNEETQDAAERTRTVYICKDRHRLTLIIHWLDHWDMASVGFFEPFDSQKEYSFPAMALGGTSGVLPLTEIFKESVEHGFRLDYTEKNWSLSHGIPMLPATWWDGSNSFLDGSIYSQVQAMLPNGNWQSFANIGLQEDAYYNKDQGRYYSAHKEPERLPGSKYYIAPFLTDFSAVRSIYNGPVDTIDKENSEQYELEPLLLVMATAANTEQNILGKIPNIYWTASPITRYGLYEENGNTYLAIPSGWVGRKFHIKNFFSVLFGEQQSNEHQVAELNRIDRLSRNMNCIIKLNERK